ncbi:MAG TPA: hypothetical protein VGR82_00190 [Methylomirabilota bacterium]|nr:hypothetical protein [Methylomirabilota bacterium]
MRQLVILALLGIATAPSAAGAQTFTSGSTGADGAFAPTADVRLAVPPGGVFNFTTITVPLGVTVSFASVPGVRQPPITMLATGNVTITGLIDVSGTDGGFGGSGTQLASNAGLGGPGGFDGGRGSNGLSGSAGGAGLGPGGGAGGTTTIAAGPAGHLLAGTGASGGAAYGTETLLPLVGGSGGGGGVAPAFGVTGGGGGGGGGAILIAASGTITFNGAIRATGGAGGAASFGAGPGAAGSGGAVRLIATSITGRGTVNLTGAAGASPGRVRVEAFNESLTVVGAPAGGVSLSTPAAVAVDIIALRIVSVGGVAAPAAPTGSLAVPDVILPAGTSGPVTVVVQASQVPPGTPVTVAATPLSGAIVSAVGTLAGTSTASTTSVTLAVPTTQPCVITATASFTLGVAP